MALDLTGLSNIRNVKGSDRVLERGDNGEEAPINDWAKAIATQFQRKQATVRTQLNNAARHGKTAFGVKWKLASGTAYGEAKPRTPRPATKKKKS